MKKAALFIALVISFIAILPLSFRLADPFFTFPFHKDWYHCVLLVWPDHVEARSFDDLAEVSPRPKGASYTFNVAPDREAWVKEQVRKLPPPNGDAGWTIHVKQLGVARQEIRLELMGDGVAGLIYEARPDQIIPLHSRLGDPGGAFVILAANLGLWGSGWLFVWIIVILKRRRNRSPAVVAA